MDNNKLLENATREVFQYAQKYGELKAQYDELKAENNSLLVKLAKAMQENDTYKDALKDIARQNKSTEWEDEGDTEHGYNCIIDVARTALSTYSNKEGE